MISNVTLLIWGQLSFILGVGGNVFVLYATIFHNAIKLDKMSIWVIKNLAVVDLCNCIFVVVPAIANQYSDGKWVFGSGTCYAYAINLFTFLVANGFLINVLSINKLVRCKYPLRNVNCSSRQRISVSLFTVMFSLSMIIWQIFALSEELFRVIQEDKMTPLKTCTTWTSERSHNASIIISFILVTVYDALPCLTLVITTTILMIYAIKKSKRPINKRNVFVVVLVTASFLLSFLPYIIFISAYFFLHGKLLDKLYEWTWPFTFLSSWSNPIIYLTMNRSFRDFTKNTIHVKQCG